MPVMICIDAAPSVEKVDAYGATDQVQRVR